MKKLRILALGICIFAAGCAQIPFERTYSLAYDGATASITLRPAGDGKVIIVPAKP